MGDKKTDFEEEILADLIEKGLSGDELLAEFKRLSSQVRPAVECMIEEADRLAHNSEDTGDKEMKEIFGEPPNAVQ